MATTPRARDSPHGQDTARAPRVAASAAGRGGPPSSTRFDTRRAAITRDDRSTVTAALMTAEPMDLPVIVDRDAEAMLARLPYGESQRFGVEVLVPTDDAPVAGCWAASDAGRGGLRAGGAPRGAPLATGG